MSTSASDLAVVAVLPPIGTVLIGVATSVAMRAALPEGTASDLIIWVSMGFAMVALPLGFLARAGARPTAPELGLVRPSGAAAATLTLLTLAVCCYELARGADVVALLLQNVPIACCEEFWCKGLIFHLGRRVFSSGVLIVAVSAAVFAFVTHTGSPVLTNLVFRLPFGLITGLIYLRTRSLAWPVLLHLNYNLLVS